jgi:hypothetical protein
MLFRAAHGAKGVALLGMFAHEKVRVMLFPNGWSKVVLYSTSPLPVLASIAKAAMSDPQKCALQPSAK